MRAALRFRQPFVRHDLDGTVKPSPPVADEAGLLIHARGWCAALLLKTGKMIDSPTRASLDIQMLGGRETHPKGDRR
jgi:hypothetical protein